MSERTLLKAIRKKCLDCSAYNAAEVKRCIIPECSLYPYRMGKKPESQRRKVSQKTLDALAKAREKNRPSQK